MSGTTTLWFLDYLGRVVSPADMDRICRNMLLSDKRREYVLRRFCHNASMFDCELLGPGYSENDQRRFMPDLDVQFRGWIESHPEELEEIQRRALYCWILTGKPLRSRHN